MNSDNCHLIFSSNDENKKIEFNGEVINNTQVQKLLGVHTDYKLIFRTNTKALCRKVGEKASCACPSYKVHVYKPSTAIYEKFIMSQFSYCPLIWICHSRKVNNQINKLHERTLRLVYK